MSSGFHYAVRATYKIPLLSSLRLAPSSFLTHEREAARGEPPLIGFLDALSGGGAIGQLEAFRVKSVSSELAECTTKPTLHRSYSQ
jgi:hypothetical protein